MVIPHMEPVSLPLMVPAVCKLERADAFTLSEGHSNPSWGGCIFILLELAWDFVFIQEKVIVFMAIAP